MVHAVVRLVKVDVRWKMIFRERGGERERVREAEIRRRFEAFWWGLERWVRRKEMGIGGHYYCSSDRFIIDQETG